MAKKYFWLKLKKDFFRDKAIKKLRSIAGGDTYTIILLKMYLLSLDKGGKIEFEGVEDTFAEELALELDEDASNVEIVLQYMEKRKLLEILSEKEFFMPYVLENTGSESESAERVRKLRERNRQKTLQCNGDVTGSNDNVRTCNTEIEIEKELDIDTEKEKIESSNELPCKQSLPASTSDGALYQEVVNLYNQYCTDGVYEYDLNDCIQDVSKMDTKQIENGYKTDTECIQSVSSGKVRDRDRIEIEIGEGESERENHRFPCEQSSPSSTPNKVQYKEIADLYNQYCTSFPKLKSLSDARKKAIKARLNSGYSLCDFKNLFKLAEESDFLKGKNDRNWRATFDWLIKDSNMAKVLDGNYSNSSKKKNNKNNSFCNFEQRDTDYDKLVNSLYGIDA